MHELAIASAILEIAEEHAAGRRVTAIQVKVGHLRQVVPSALCFSFEVAARETVAEGARLEIESVPADGVCRRCGAVTRLNRFPFCCAGCGEFDLRIVSGEELYVESLELLEDGAPEEEAEEIEHGGP